MFNSRDLYFSLKESVTMMPKSKGPVSITSADKRKPNTKISIMLLIEEQYKIGKPVDAAYIKRVLGLPQGTIGSSLSYLCRTGDLQKKKKPGKRGYWYEPGPKRKVKIEQPDFSLELKTFKEKRKTLVEAKQVFDSALSQVNGALNILEARVEHMEKKEARLTQELKAARDRANAAEAEHIKLLKKLEELSKF